MRTKIDRETLVKARDAAEQLKGELLKRLAGKRRGAMSCGCGAIHNGEAEVVDITFTNIDGPYADQIGLYEHFSCHMREICNRHKSDYDYSMSVSSFLPWAELHIMFRNVFGPIGVPTDHLFAEAFTRGTGFQASGQEAEVRVGQPLHVRPIGDLSKSLWLNAQVRIDRDVPRFQKGSLVACVIDPFEKHYGGNPIERIVHYARLSDTSTEFAARQFDLNKLNPIVKIVSASADGMSAIVQTHIGIEFYQP